LTENVSRRGAARKGGTAPSGFPGRRTRMALFMHVIVMTGVAPHLVGAARGPLTTDDPKSIRKKDFSCVSMSGAS
jgi:hypothetical protein